MKVMSRLPVLLLAIAALGLYSLGNALFDQYGLADTRRSALVLVTLHPHVPGEVQVILFLIDIQNSRIVTAGKGDAQVIMQYFKRGS